MSNMKKLLVILSCALFAKSGLANNIHFWESQQNRATELLGNGNYKEALKIFKEVAEETSSQHSQFQIAWIYHNGFGVEINCREAARWYTLAANSGSNTAQNNLSSLYDTGCSDLPRNSALAFQYLVRSAENGNSRAQANLANKYAYGEEIKKNPYEAYNLAQRSAEQNDINGILLLARFFQEGIGVPINPNKAFALTSTAARMKAGDWDSGSKQLAQLNLGKMLFNGNGTVRDHISAYQWFLLSEGGPRSDISEESKEYLNELGNILTSSDRENAKNLAASIVNMPVAVSQEDLVAALKQAMENGKEMEVISIAQSLVDQGHPVGETYMGLMYREGYSTIKQDIDEAYILFKRACKAGEWDACAYQVESLVAVNRREAANDLLTHISKSAPESDPMQLLLAELYMMLGHTSAAEGVIRKVLVNDPINEHAKYLLSELHS